MAIALSDHQQQVIREALSRQFGNDVSIWVFGSRARGVTSGDIDLYAETRSASRPTLLQRLTVQTELQSALHAKVDLIVRSASGEKRAFDQMAKHTGVAI